MDRCDSNDRKRLPQSGALLVPTVYAAHLYDVLLEARFHALDTLLRHLEQDEEVAGTPFARPEGVGGGVAGLGGLSGLGGFGGVGGNRRGHVRRQPQGSSHMILILTRCRILK